MITAPFICGHVGYIFQSVLLGSEFLIIIKLMGAIIIGKHLDVVFSVVVFRLHQSGNITPKLLAVSIAY